MRKVSAAIVLAAMFASLGATSVAAASNVWFVDDDGLAGSNGCNGHHSVPAVIQDAVDAAAPGDTVKVCPGTYVGTVDVSKQGLRLTATQAWAAVIKAPAVMSGALVNLHDASNLYLRWFKIVASTTGTCSTPNSLVLVSYAPNSQVRANHLGIDGPESNGCRSFIVGINVSNSADTLVVWNRITDFSGVGIQEFGSTNSIIRGNTVQFLHAALACCAYSDSVGILTGSAGTTVRGNMVRALPTAGDTTPGLQVGINMFDDNEVVWRNMVRYTNTGIQTIGAIGVHINENRLHGTRNFGILLANTSIGEVSLNTVRSNSRGIQVNDSSSLNNIHDNDFRGPGSEDCLDFSSGGGTAGTANTWTSDLGDEASPAGICSAAP